MPMRTQATAFFLLKLNYKSNSCTKTQREMRLLITACCFWVSFALQAQDKVLNWYFPIQRTHAGILLGNGTQGLMVWGQGNQLNITIGRSGFWDHRGGNAFALRTNYADVKKMIQNGDEKALRAAFALPKSDKPNLNRPQQIGGGRLELKLPTGWKLLRGELVLTQGIIKIFAQKPSGKIEILSIRQAPDEELAWIVLPPNCTASGQLVPAYEFAKDQLEAAGIQKPIAITENIPHPVRGFTQTLPSDQPLSIAFKGGTNGTPLVIASHLGMDEKNVQILAKLETFDLKKRTRNSQDFWRSYWRDVPTIRIPDPAVQEIIDYGLYKQACSTPPQGLACTLQGPFMEEYQLPPWSCDYHFNINVEMIYWPALATNRLSHFGPLWKMINNWMPQLQANGKAFFGREGALLLPHAVDDRCQVVGTFWTGTIDHACTAWMAQMAWQHYRYGMDKNVLTQTAWPLLVGAFEGYWAMLEEVEKDGKKVFTLPISVSPEYGGDGFKAAGRDASFQLAALHRIARILPQAAQLMGKDTDPRWADVSERLPQYTTFEGIFQKEWGLKNTRIALWEGQDLIESHRHHSHLGAIYPFQTISISDPKHQQIVRSSIGAWKYIGAGGWSGWCVPWASIIYSRTGESEAAVNWLHYWKDNYTNEGRGTLHNADNNGTGLLGAPDWNKEPKNREVMQLDAGFGALNAALELLVQCREDGIYVLPQIPRRWRELSFENVRTEGAFQVSAVVKEGKIRAVTVKSLSDNTLNLVHGLGETYTLAGKKMTGTRLERRCKAGEVLELKAF